MTARTFLLGAAASLALAGSANATNINGWYVSLEGGANWVEDWDHTFSFPGSVPASAQFDTGWAVLASVGYGWGNWRFELEGGYRDNNGDGGTFAFAPFQASLFNYDLTEASAMINALYDFPLSERLSLSIGAGAGADFAMADLNYFLVPEEDDDWSFAYQGIAGLNYAIGRQTDLFLNYRYFRVTDVEFKFPTIGATVEGDDVVKHTATIGLRYHFGAPYVEPVPEAAPPPPPPPPPAEAPREYIVFFGHNKSNLTAEAMDVVKQAAAAAKQYGSATIRVVGHADRSGSARYNQGLSMRRARAVGDALVGEGIGREAISVSAKGESEPMVPTADGVREPQNRRVHITL